MTIEEYNMATKILEEVKQLEEKIYQLQMSIGFRNSKDYEEISSRLFILGQEFAAL
jgi:hypothetical protein